MTIYLHFPNNLVPISGFNFFAKPFRVCVVPLWPLLVGPYPDRTIVARREISQWGRVLMASSSFANYAHCLSASCVFRAIWLGVSSSLGCPGVSRASS
jgi:hypothetical protein